MLYTVQDLSKRHFFKDVYAVVKEIPLGRISTYGAIARYLGSPQSSRMVGWAMNQTHLLEENIPAHRVVNRMGMLSGKMHFRGESMESLLRKEGIEVREDVIVDFETKFWDPNIELSL